LSQQLQGRGGTLFGTDTATGAFTAIDGVAVRSKFQSVFRTNLQTGFTANAAIADPVDLGEDRNTFWIVAPFAFKTAAFKKNSGADTRAVFGGHALNFEYGCFHILIRHNLWIF
jgi:hypothetical protein